MIYKMIIQNFNWKNIDYINGIPYNPDSQVVVERFHKTIKDLLYVRYLDNEKSFNLRESLEIVLKKYNNHIHSSTKYSLIFSHKNI